MPEGPEVKTVTVHLNEKLSSQTLVGVTCLRSDKYFSINGKTENRFSLLRSILPATVETVFCKGKCIFFKLYSIDTHEVYYLYCHLIMTGRWTEKSTNSQLTLKFGRRIYRNEQPIRLVWYLLYYNDGRRLGHFNLLTTNQLETKLNSLGPDILSESVNWQQWLAIIRRYPKRQLVSFLMDQSCICGIGNYLKCEILYRSRLAPSRKVGTLTKEENKILYEEAIKTITESYSYGGLTIRDFWHPDGKRGTFPVQVYNRKTDPHGNMIKRGKFSDGRTTCWVPSLQF